VSDSTTIASPTLLRLDNISKHFPGTIALDGIDFDLNAGEVHILFGENGAGKSTLIQTIAGVFKQTSGEMFLNGRRIDFQSVQHARSAGVSAVFQEFSLIPQLSVEENLFLGDEPSTAGFLNKTESKQRAKEMLDRLGFPLHPNDPVMYLSRAEQQMVEIAKAFRKQPSIMILDEPTSSLTEKETDRLFELIAEMRDQNIGVIYITHRMNEIKRIGDRITVFRDGRKVTTTNVSDVDDNKLVELMTGRVITQMFPEVNFNPSSVVLEAAALSTADGALVNNSMNIRAGEIVGLAGLIGSGKSQAGRACFGLEKIAAGKVMFQGQDVTGCSPRQMLDHGLCYVTSDRRNEGLVMMHNVTDNIALPSLNLSNFSWGPFLRRRNAQVVVQELASRLNLQPPKIDTLLEHFSGGNQQKVLVGKALARPIQMFIFDEPTVGVDVGARVAIYELIRDLCESGAAILLISSDLPEILHLTNRVYVMHKGEQCAELEGSDINEASILRYFFEQAA
jgi:ribose transport system ATP-binding protein